MNASDILKYGHLTVLRAIDGLPEADWETGGVCGVWSVKDIIAHLASYEHVLEEILSSFQNDSAMPSSSIGGSATPTLNAFVEPGGHFNDDQVALRRNNSSAEVLAEYASAHEQVMALAAHIPPETLRLPGTLPWYGMEYALDDFIVYSFYGHKREHCAQIAVFRDRLAA
ncbi:MAG TPA: maleylpyruvate isomerase N-terminal domain-containing protein [Roseiflexaceae bacterium]|nr:maleylpyruvate isomerase N-terminal domain-containing protein [Roseiflexaceae bacterium]